MFRELIERNAITNYTYHKLAIQLKPLVLQAVTHAFNVESASGTTKEVNQALAENGVPNPQRMLTAAALGSSTFQSVVLPNNLDLPRDSAPWVPTAEQNITHHGTTVSTLKHPGIVLIFWDRTTATGFFIYDGRKTKSCSRRRTVSQAANYTTYIFPGRMIDWNRGKFIKKINFICAGHGIQPSNFWALNKSKHRLLTTTWSREHASRVINLLWLQQNWKQRQTFLKRIGGLINANPAWNSGLMIGVAAKNGTVRSYMSHIRDFAEFKNCSTKQILTLMIQRKLDCRDIHIWLWDRLHGEVRYTTAVNAITAFSWFYSILRKESFNEVHKGTLSWIKKLRRHWQLQHRGAAELCWDDILIFIKHIKSFDWDGFDADRIFDCAVISLWAALRTGEALNLHLNHVSFVILKGRRVIEVPTMRPGALLRITLFNVKTCTGNKTVSKFVPPFPLQPEFCPHRAFTRLTQRAGGYFSNSEGSPLSQSLLNQRLRPYVKWVVPKYLSHLMDKRNKMTWYMFRVSYFNIAVTELDVPVHQTSVHATHRNPNTIYNSYIHHTDAVRRFKMAQLVQDHVDAFVRLAKPAGI